MSICVIGINHKTAPIALREQVYFSVEKLPLYLQDLLNQSVLHEAVLLSTCNRSELYCHVDDIDVARDWFYAQTTAPRHELSSAVYVYRDVEAITHIMQVACGLDSMVIGEPQILGQMKESFSESCTAGAVGPLFHRLFQQVFAIAKEVRTNTAIGACPVSVASAAVQLSKEYYTDFANAKIALIGAGETTELLMRYLTSIVKQPLSLVNRSHERAALLAAEWGGQVYGLDELPSVLQEVDVVFSATSSAVPIITKSSLSDVIAHRQNKPLMLFDIAVPRDIDPAIAELSGVTLYCIDDLKGIIEKNRKGREHAADKANELIHAKSQALLQELQSFDKVAHTIRAYRSQIEALCYEELIKAKQQLYQGGDPAVVLERFADAFTKKLMHAPSVQIRQAGVEGRFEFLRFAKQLFSLPDFEAGSL